MRRMLIVLTALATLTGLAAAQEAAPVTVEEATQNLQQVLEAGVAETPTPQLLEAFQTYREAIADDAELQVVALAVSDVEAALTAEPFDQPTLVNRLQLLALAMRAAADAGDATLTVELASLVDQTADFIQDEGWVPRMEVEAP